MGDKQITTLNLKIVAVDEDEGLIMVSGSVPGSEGSYVLIRDAVKKKAAKDAPKPAGVKSATKAAAKETQAEVTEEPAVDAAPAAEAQPE